RRRRGGGDHARRARGLRLARRAARARDEPRRSHALRAQPREPRPALSRARRRHDSPRARSREPGRASGGGRGALIMPDVLMPKLSDTMEEGKIIRWLKQRGERVAIGDILAEVETDKANMELEAYDEGVLSEIRTPEGESAPVGAVIAVLGEGEARGGDGAKKPEAPAKQDEAQPGPEPAAAKEREAPTAAKEREAPAAPKPARTQRGPAPARPAQREAPAARPAAAPPEAEDRVRASPLARRIARDRGVDLSGIEGTGPGGRIVERDVERAQAKPRPAAEPAAKRAEPVSRPRPVEPSGETTPPRPAGE